MAFTGNGNGTATQPALAPIWEDDEWLMMQRRLLAEQLRYVEARLVERGKITRVLCAPPKSRDE